MRLTFITEVGHSYVIEVDPQMELENIMALLEAESDIPAAEQSISLEGRELTDPKATLASFGIGDEAVLTLRKKVTVAGRTVAQDAEMIRLQVLGDPDMMRQLQETSPDLANAAVNDPARFAILLRQTRERQIEAELKQQREISALNADPFNLDAQQRIEEAIRQQTIAENLEHAMEHFPEAFGRVNMLYIPVEVNGHPVKAFVDSGAQQTIMSPECAEACGIMRLMDTRFAGIAKGVGTAKILGRVHSAQLKVADIFLPCSFTIMEGRDVELLFGLDMLKAHQACIDLEKNALRIRDREVPFLPEHEIPKGAIEQSMELQDAPASSSPAGPSSSTPSNRQFPGGGHALGSAPASRSSGNTPRPAPAPNPPSQPSQPSGYSERDVKTLMDFGASRETAIQALQAAGGNVDLAAGFIF